MQQLACMIIPLVFAGFVVFLMVDGSRRFNLLKKSDPVKAECMHRLHALMITLLVVFFVMLLGASFASFADQFPAIAAKLGVRAQSKMEMDV